MSTHHAKSIWDGVQSTFSDAWTTHHRISVFLFPMCHLAKRLVFVCLFFAYTGPGPGRFTSLFIIEHWEAGSHRVERSHGPTTNWAVHHCLASFTCPINVVWWSAGEELQLRRGGRDGTVLFCTPFLPRTYVKPILELPCSTTCSPTVYERFDELDDGRLRQHAIKQASGMRAI